MVFELERSRGGAAITQLGVRVVVMRAGTFIDLQKSLEKVLGDEAAALLYEAGMRAGRNSAQTLIKEWGREDFVKKWRRFYGSDGCGWFNLEEFDLDSGGEGVVRVRESFIAEGYGGSEKPVCHFLCGFLVGTFQELFGSRLTCEEVKCAAAGDPFCEFKLERFDPEEY